jgi:hypothetical protein
MMTPDEISTQVDLRSRWHRKAILCVVLVVVLSLCSIKFDGDFLKEKGKIPAKQTGSTEIPARGYTTALKSVYSKANIQNPSSNSTSNRSEMPVSSPMPALLHTPANKDNTRASTNVPSSTFLTKQSPCFRADSATTESLLLQNRVLSKPIINVGMPKCGSSTLEHFFHCAGMKTSHWSTKRHGPIGVCMRDAIKRGLPPIKSCDSWYRGRGKAFNESFDSGVEALLQIDTENNEAECVFPQMSYLEELHAEAPNATYILNFRPVMDWVSSLIRCEGMGKAMYLRLQNCNLPDFPKGKGNTTAELKDWLCGHVRNIRNFVAEHPSYSLIELNLYETRNADIMSTLFHTDPSCWVHANKNTKEPPRRHLQARVNPIGFQMWT